MATKMVKGEAVKLVTDDSVKALLESQGWTVAVEEKAVEESAPRRGRPPREDKTEE